MALDQLRLVLNRIRRLQDSEDPDIEKIGELREQAGELLSESNAKIIMKCHYEREIRMDEIEDNEWVIDRMLDNSTLSQEEILVDDVRDDLDCYVCWDDIEITLEDENGKELDSFC